MLINDNTDEMKPIFQIVEGNATAYSCCFTDPLDFYSAPPPTGSLLLHRRLQEVNGGVMPWAFAHKDTQSRAGCQDTTQLNQLA